MLFRGLPYRHIDALVMKRADGGSIDACLARQTLQVQLDSITVNELGDPSAIASIPGHPEKRELQNWETTPRLGARSM